MKTEARRHAIVEAAKYVFRQYGFEVASMDMIAKEFGGSKATLYNYFKSKEEIFFAVVQNTVETDFGPIFLILRQDEGKPLSRLLTQFGGEYLRITLAPNVIAARRMVLAESQRSNIGQHFYENGPGLVIKRIAEFFDHEVSEGRLKPCDTDVAAKHFKALLYAELHEPYQMGCIDNVEQGLIDDVVKRAVDAFLASYQA
ncbi:TetR/AcrR family transcriptional regulator [Alteromonas sp. C1M14]|uniref:TetR/AcrR family transcriptional regulator n=1 Tax=Alteromonas sp. C1M14 TaxID=2841567 RepID=UPI001C0831AC|nr:TetR/AcrR family transcriptional regulator [Alteromonas sp. C1M14]